MTFTTAALREERECAVFSRVVAGADGSEPGFEACRQAARLVEPDGFLEVFTAVDLAQASLAGWSAARIAEQLERGAREAGRKGAEIAGAHATARLVEGPPYASLIAELIETRATLVAVGSHGHSRWGEIVAGGVCGELLHGAPCSVLVARPPTPAVAFPARVVVGYDGSDEAKRVLVAAKHLARRFAASIRVVTAVGGKPLELNLEHPIGPLLHLSSDHPVQTLVDAARDADLLVVGSRGLHGLRALGSVSERVAHEAPCSVLVVREPAP